MKKVFYFFSLLFFCYTSNGQFVGLVINEFSQGSSGEKEYIELVVVGKRTCTQTTADLRGWIIDDQNGWYTGGTTNTSNAPGHHRFNINNSTWSAVPFGSIIVIYNPADKNTSLPTSDIIDPDNFKYIVSISGTNLGSSLFQQQNTPFPFSEPNSFTTSRSYVYPASSNTSQYSSATNTSWGNAMSINNSSSSSPGDVISTISPSKRDSAFFSVAHKFLTATPYHTPKVSLDVVSGGNVAFLTDANYTTSSSWSIQPVTGNETPGVPNGGANTTWINSMRADPIPPTVTVNSPTACQGTTATVTAMPSPTTGTYTYSWTVPPEVPTTIPRPGSVPSFQTSFAGQYTVTITDAAGCTATGSGTVTIQTRPNAPKVDTIQPRCETPKGTIKVTTPAPGTSIFYSIDGITYTNTSGVFDNLAPGSYKVSYKDANSCISADTTVQIVAAQPNPPTFPLPELQKFCSSPNRTIQDILVNKESGLEIKWYNTLFSTTPLLSSTLLHQKGTKSYFATQTRDGCESVRKSVTVDMESPEVTISATSLCEGSGTNAELKFEGTPGATVTYTANGSPRSIKIESNGIGQIQYPSITSDTTYMLTGVSTLIGTSTCKVTASGRALIKKIPKPVAKDTQTFCPTFKPKVSNLDATGTNLQWYTDLTGGTLLNLSDPLIHSRRYYVSQAFGGCETGRTEVYVLVPPSATPQPKTTQQFCNANATVADLSPYPDGTLGDASFLWYDQSGGPALSSSTKLLSGLYYVTRVIEGCPSERATITVTLNLPAKPNASVTVEPTCTTGGTIKVSNPIDGATYFLKGPANNIITSSDKGEFPGLRPDTYSVFAKTGPTCTSADTIIVIQPPASNLIASAVFTNPSCDKLNGSITAFAANGIEPYQYSINRGTYSIKKIFPNLSAGRYIISVKDAIGCTDDDTIVLSNLPSTIIAAAITTDEICGQKNGAFTVKASKGQAPYTYSMDGSTTQTDSLFKNLAAGTYAIRITDASECTFDTSFKVNSLGSTITASAITSDETCGQKNGAFTVKAIKGKAPYTYSIDGSTAQTDSLFKNLAAGIYAIKIRDASQCTFDTSFKVSSLGSTITASAITTDETCGQKNGAFTVKVSKGKAPYTFSIDGSTAQTDSLFKNLAAGTYAIRITDASKCTFDTSFKVSSLGSTITASAITTDETCEQKNGAFTVKVSKGKAPYTFSIDGSTAQTDSLFKNLSAGTYAIRITDVSQCTFDTSFKVNSLGSTITASAITIDETCGQKNGALTVKAVKGKAPYTFSINGSTAQTDSVFKNLAAGTYAIRITDASECTFDTSFKVNSLGSTITASAITTDETCGQKNGAFTVKAVKGKAPYTYSINGSTAQTDSVFKNLAAGTYAIKITDASQCTFDTSFKVNSLGSAITTSATTTNSACGISIGTITASATGSSSYTYSLNGGSFTFNNVFNNLAAGTYKITVQDAAGCSDDTNVIIKQTNTAVTQSSSLFGCKSVSYNGVTYTSSTVVRDTIRTSQNCDSIYRIANITVQNTTPITRTATVNGCDSVVFNSITYRTSTVIRDTLRTTIGCDSVYVVTNINVTTFRLSLTASANPAFAGTTVFLTTSSTVAYQAFSWQPAHLFPLQKASNQRITADSSRTIKVIAESNSGCIDTAQLFIEVKEYTDFFIPNAFSPNGDGKNDLFLLMGTTINKGRVRVFNQWGEILFATEDIRKGWDGNSKGRPQPVGIYVYEVHVTMHNGTEIKRKGFINLIR